MNPLGFGNINGFFPCTLLRTTPLVYSIQEILSSSLALYLSSFYKLRLLTSAFKCLCWRWSMQLKHCCLSFSSTYANLTFRLSSYLNIHLDFGATNPTWCSNFCYTPVGYMFFLCDLTFCCPVSHGRSYGRLIEVLTSMWLLDHTRLQNLFIISFTPLFYITNRYVKLSQLR